MGETLLLRAQAQADELCALRHALHREPELGNREHRTAERLERALGALGMETVRLLDTAVVGVLRGALPGRTVALRADMDALPLTEATGAAFSSQRPGLMHGCGHDFHMAAALGAAALLAERRSALPGTALFFFQPDEEGGGGAQRMIDAGCMDAPPVDAVFGCHVSPALPAGTVGIRYGRFYAASNPFTVVIHGKSAHGAEPEQGLDALAAGAELVCALKGLGPDLSRRLGPVVLSVGRFQSGTAGNIIADRAELTGILRSLGPEARREAVRALEETVGRVAAAAGTSAELEVRESYPGIVNEERMTALAEGSARRLLGDQRVVRLPEPTMTTEDFGYYLLRAPGCFYHLGVGGAAPLHSPAFLPADALLPTAAALHGQILLDFLEA